jgi:hypothetical protein
MPAIRRRTWFVALASAMLGTGAFVSTAATAATLEGSGRAATETRSLGSFKAISTKGNVDLIVRQGEPASVIVRSDDNLLPYLETVIEGDALVVRWKSGQSLRTKAKTYVEVVTPTLSAYSSAGSGDLKLESFKTPALALALSGSGDATLAALTTEELRIRISGSGDVKGAGRATRVDIGISGSGDVGLSALEAEEVAIRIAGSGDAAVHAAKTLKVSIAGSGDVSYTGDAQLTSSVAGSGRVRKR